MATRSKTKTATKRTKVKDLPKSKKELSGKSMKKVKGGFTGGVFVASGDVDGDTPIGIKAKVPR